MVAESVERSYWHNDEREVQLSRARTNDPPRDRSNPRSPSGREGEEREDKSDDEVIQTTGDEAVQTDACGRG